MYGTIARMKARAGSRAAIEAEMERQVAEESAPGHLGTFVYRSDRDPDEYLVSVVFESREAYRANAGSPEQAARYGRLRALLAADREWHDGEVVHGASRLAVSRG
jgi:heme-degrading monooxygenase HmoA